MWRVILLLLFATPAFAQQYQTRVVSVGTTPVQVVPAVGGRLTYTVKLARAASAVVYCGSSASDNAFEIAAGDAYTFEKMTRLEIWCRAASGTQTVYVMELR